MATSTGKFYGQPMTAGDIYTVAGDGTAGTPATAARPPRPSSTTRQGVTIDGRGQPGHRRHRQQPDPGGRRHRAGTFYGQAMTAGDIYTVAGNGTAGYSGNGGPATKAELGSPHGVATDAAGNLLIADTGNNRIRVVAG